MALYDRLIDVGGIGNNIPVHQFMAALGEMDRGKMTETQAATLFGLDSSEQAEMATLANRIKSIQDPVPLHGRVTLTNVGTAYDTNIDSQSLPFVYVQKAGVTRIDIELRVRKVGTGTQDWQVWNETDGVEAIGPGSITSGSLSDAGSAADRTLSASRVFGAALSAGVVKLRLRCKSSTAADDPVFLNGTLLLFRAERLTAAELHEILLLAAYPNSIYNSVSALQTRLGV